MDWSARLNKEKAVAVIQEKRVVGETGVVRWGEAEESEKLQGVESKGYHKFRPGS